MTWFISLSTVCEKRRGLLLSKPVDVIWVLLARGAGIPLYPTPPQPRAHQRGAHKHTLTHTVQPAVTRFDDYGHALRIEYTHGKA